MSGVWANPGAAHKFEFSQEDTDTLPPPLRDETLPEIEARSYSVKISKRSATDRLYLIEDLTGARPIVGHLVLLRNGAEPVMAFRVIRSEPDRKIFIARRVRRYGDHKTLENNSEFTAIERMSEYPMQASLEGGPSEEDEIRQLMLEEQSAQPSWDDVGTQQDLDSALDQPGGNASSGRMNLGPGGSGLNGLDSQDELGLGGAYEVSNRNLEIDDVQPMDRLKYSLSAQLGLFRSETFLATPAYYSGGGVRLGVNIGRMILAKRSHIQDLLTLEGGLFFYSLQNYEQPDDSYNILPVIVTLRYTLFFSETIGVHAYGGVIRNNVIGSDNSTDASLAILNKTGPAAGGGLWFRLGPHWDLRVDAGMDMIGAGLVLNF